MKKVTMLSARVDSRIKNLADKWCKSRGLIMSKFIEEAILDKLEEVEDASEIQKLRGESARPFEDVLKELKFS